MLKDLVPALHSRHVYQWNCVCRRKKYNRRRQAYRHLHFSSLSETFLSFLDIFLLQEWSCSQMSSSAPRVFHWRIKAWFPHCIWQLQGHLAPTPGAGPAKHLSWACLGHLQFPCFSHPLKQCLAGKKHNKLGVITSFNTVSKRCLMWTFLPLLIFV